MNEEKISVSDDQSKVVKPKWLRSRDVREMLNISDSTLQSMRISRAIPAYKLGASWFYREDEIEEALENGATHGKEVKNG